MTNHINPTDNDFACCLDPDCEGNQGWVACTSNFALADRNQVCDILDARDAHFRRARSLATHGAFAIADPEIRDAWLAANA